MEIKANDNNNIKENNKNGNTDTNVNKKVEERKNRFSGVTSYELLKIVKQTSGFPKKLTSNIPLETLVNFYNRYWNGDVTDDESDTSSSP